MAPALSGSSMRRIRNTDAGMATRPSEPNTNARGQRRARHRRQVRRRDTRLVGERQVTIQAGTGDVAASSRPIDHTRPWWLAALLIHRQFAAVLMGFGVAAVVIPTFIAAPVGDDWVYSRSVEILIREGRLRVLDLTVVTLVFQVAWGALFSSIFGLSFGALRLSTVVLTSLSGLGFYGLCRELEVDRGRSALASALYLFNPLALVLSFTFMTDPHFSALLVCSSYFYVRGLRLSDPFRPAIVAGSALATCAFLVRQQGALIPLAVVVYLIMAKRIRFERASVWRFVDVVAVPVVATIAYYLWLFLVHGVPEQQDAFLQQVVDAGWSGSWQLIRYMTYIEAVYIGFIMLPIAVACVPSFRRLLPRGLWRWNLVAAWATMLLIGLVAFGLGPGRMPPAKMPYISQFVGMHGVGPTDLWGGRAWLIGNGALVQDVLTWVSAGSSMVFALAIARRLGNAPNRDRAAAALVATIGLWQVVGVLPPSYHFRTWIISVDRYLLPLLPFAILLFVWSLRGVRLWMPLAWVVIALAAAYSTLATRDFLVFQHETWQLASYSNETVGIPLTKLDAGSSWDGYHLYEFSVANDIPQQTRSGPWWTNLFGPATDSTFVISSSSHFPKGYEAIAWTEYSSWLNTRPVYLFLLQRSESPAAAEER